MLSSAITGKSLQLIAWRHAKIGQHNGGIHHPELAAGDLKDDGKPFGFSPANTIRVRLSAKALIMRYSIMH